MDEAVREFTLNTDNIHDKYAISSGERLEVLLSHIDTTHLHPLEGLATEHAPANEEIKPSASQRFHGKLYERAKEMSASGRHSLSGKDTRNKLELFQSVVLRTIEDFADPWADYHIEKIPAERVRSYRYSYQNKEW